MHTSDLLWSKLFGRLGCGLVLVQSILIGGECAIIGSASITAMLYARSMAISEMVSNVLIQFIFVS